VVAEEAPPAPLDEQPRLLQIALLAGGARQLGERRLDLGMPTDPGAAVGAELAADVVGRLPRHRHQPVLAVGAQPRHRRLDEVAVAVQLVPVLQVAVAHARSLVAEAGVEVAVRLLGGRDQPGQLDDRPLGGVGARPAGLPAERLQQLVDLGVGELPAAAVGERAPVGGHAEVLHPARPRHPGSAVVDDHLAAELLPVRPEARLQPDLADAEGAHGARTGDDRSPPAAGEVSHGSPPT
jgi:hypothetical protein